MAGISVLLEQAVPTSSSINPAQRNDVEVRLLFAKQQLAAGAALPPVAVEGNVTTLKHTAAAKKGRVAKPHPYK